MPKKQKNGLYRARIKIGVDADGKDIYKYFSGKTKKELEDNRRKLTAMYVTGEMAAEDVIFGPYCINWYKTMKEQKLAQNSQTQYRSMLNRYILPAFGTRNMRSIRASELQEFFEQFNGKCKAYSVVAKSILNSVLNLACNDGIIQRNPLLTMNLDIKASKVKEKPPLSIEERQRIVDYCNVKSDAFYIACLYYLGIRFAELLGLTWADIDFKTNTVTIIQSWSPRTNDFAPLKTDAAKRIVPMPDALKRILYPLRGLPNMRLCPCTHTAALRHFKRDMQNIGICITPHVLRHNYITICWEHGIDVFATAKFVGHSSPNITLQIYTHLSKERKEAQAQKVREMF